MLEIVELTMNEPILGAINDEASSEFYDEEDAKELASFDIFAWLKDKGLLDLNQEEEADQDNWLL